MLLSAVSTVASHCACVQKNKKTAQRSQFASSHASAGCNDVDETKSLSPFSSSSTVADVAERLAAEGRASSVAADVPLPLTEPALLARQMSLLRNASFFTPQNIPQSKLMRIAVALLQAVTVRIRDACPR